MLKIELDQSPNPTLETIQKLAKALGVSLDDLVNK
ncbi:MAG TPA: helix-turn-helix transcriptional regulator [Candidatus Pacearchaeota archaeon]|nr:helix-turn-helix transcriptional regulator [Candidatus Pacearchaeota archaeon]